VRRPHPLQNSGTGCSGLLEAIEKERQLLSKVRQLSDLEIDTSALSIHDLARTIRKSIAQDSGKELNIHVMSFGFKHGLPIDAEFVVDMRWLPNPFWVEELKNLTGNDAKVQEYVLSSAHARDFLDKFIAATSITFDRFVHENKPNLTVAFGCTGGIHRSVAFANAYAKQLRELGYQVSVNNRDIEKE
jgi:UPF0042 nucleotide-binding protein